MMRPYFLETMWRATACETKKVPRRFVFSTVFQSSQVTSRAGLRMLQPALLTFMSRLQHDFEQTGFFFAKPVEPDSAFGERSHGADERRGLEDAARQQIQTFRVFAA